MGLLARLWRKAQLPVIEHEPSVPKQREAWTVPASILDGREDLEVVGESHYQDALWRLCSGTLGDEVRCDIIAVLVPEPANPYDPSAICVLIDGKVAGYLPRATAREYLPGLKRAMSSHGSRIALRGVIAGGGQREDGPGLLGVFVKHNPADFGLKPAHEAGRPTVTELRQLLTTSSDPLTRHFQFAELESSLYRCRDQYDSALTEYDEACAQHDAEMESICEAFMAKEGEVPLLDTYRQMAIRQQKTGDWAACRWWADRGLALYSQHRARQEAVDDLVKRRDRAAAKLEAAAGRGARKATPRRSPRP